MMSEKIVYMDSGKSKVLRGDLLDEDDYFITIRCADKNVFKIGKSAVVSMRFEGDERDEKS